MIIDWDTYFMSVALLSSLRSKDPVTQVGCCIVDSENNHIVGCGYNGMINCRNNDSIFSWNKSDDPSENKQSYVIHAEANGILNSNYRLKGCKIYTTLFPCNECCKLIIQSGIKEVIYLKEKNKPLYDISKNMMDICGIVYRKMENFSFPKFE